MKMKYQRVLLLSLMTR